MFLVVNGALKGYGVRRHIVIALEWWNKHNASSYFSNDEQALESNVNELLTYQFALISCEVGT